MILAEKNIRTMGKMFKVKVECAHTRRLTTIEWLVLSCVKKFYNDAKVSKHTLKEVFDEIFHLQSSEFLIKPCILSLSSLKVINVVDWSTQTYSALRFENISLTDLGMRMLDEGLLPGELFTLPLDIYYNPVTGDISSVIPKDVITDDCVDFSGYLTEELLFPKDSICEDLKKGRLGSNKFVASKSRIEDIEEIASTEWECATSIIIESDGDKINISPTIISNEIRRHIDELLIPKNITNEYLRSLPKEIPNGSIILGSGDKIKNAIGVVCKNGRNLFISASAYAAYKRNSSFFKGKTIVIFGAEKNSVDLKGDVKIITIINEPELPGCAVVNEFGDALSLAQVSYQYEGREINIPVAVEEKSIKDGRYDLLGWFSNACLIASQNDINFSIAFELPFMLREKERYLESLRDRWLSIALPDALNEIKKCVELHLENKVGGFSIPEKKEFFIKLCENNKEVNIMSIVLDFISSGIDISVDEKRELLSYVIRKIAIPTTYAELVKFCYAFGITTAEEEAIMDDVVAQLYSGEIIKDVYEDIMNSKYEKHMEVFSLDSFFNEYNACINDICFLINENDIFTEFNTTKIQNAVLNCPDIASLQSSYAQIMEKHVVLANMGININKLSHEIASNKADNFYANLRLLDEHINKTISGIIEKQDEGKAIRGKIYIVDTCAFIHQPELLSYFSEDEYARIPAMVIDELGKLKDYHAARYIDLSKQEASIAARRVVGNITGYLKTMNEVSPIRLAIENSHPDLLPSGLDPNVPDNMILSVALYYHDLDPTIITDDKQFMLAASGQGIKSIESLDYIEEHKKNYRRVDTTTTINNVGDNSLDRKVKSSSNNGISVLFTGEMDDKPLSEAKEVLNELSPAVIEYLRTKKIKTIGQLKSLSVSYAETLPINGRQAALRNAVVRIVKKIQEFAPFENEEGGESVSEVLTTTLLELAGMKPTEISASDASGDAGAKKEPVSVKDLVSMEKVPIATIQTYKLVVLKILPQDIPQEEMLIEYKAGKTKKIFVAYDSNIKEAYILQSVYMMYENAIKKYFSEVVK